MQSMCSILLCLCTIIFGESERGDACALPSQVEGGREYVSRARHLTGAAGEGEEEVISLVLHIACRACLPILAGNGSSAASRRAVGSESPSHAGFGGWPGLIQFRVYRLKEKPSRVQ